MIGEIIQQLQHRQISLSVSDKNLETKPTKGGMYQLDQQI